MPSATVGGLITDRRRPTLPKLAPRATIRRCTLAFCSDCTYSGESAGMSSGLLRFEDRVSGAPIRTARDGEGIADSTRGAEPAAR